MRDFGVDVQYLPWMDWGPQSKGHHRALKSQVSLSMNNYNGIRNQCVGPLGGEKTNLFGMVPCQMIAYKPALHHPISPFNPQLARYSMTWPHRARGRPYQSALLLCLVMKPCDDSIDRPSSRGQRDGNTSSLNFFGCLNPRGSQGSHRALTK